MLPSSARAKAEEEALKSLRQGQQSFAKEDEQVEREGERRREQSDASIAIPLVARFQEVVQSTKINQSRCGDHNNNRHKCLHRTI